MHQSSHVLVKQNQAYLQHFVLISISVLKNHWREDLVLCGQTSLLCMVYYRFQNKHHMITYPESDNPCTEERSGHARLFSWVIFVTEKDIKTIQLMLFAYLNWLINALEDPWRYCHLNLMIEVGIGKCTGSPVKRKGLSSKEGVKLFFICCRGLGGLLLFMSAKMDAWVRGKHYCGMLLSRPWSFSLRCITGKIRLTSSYDWKPVLIHSQLVGMGKIIKNSKIK